MRVLFLFAVAFGLHTEALTKTCLVPAATSDLLQELSFERDRAPRGIVFGNDEAGYFEAPVQKIAPNRFSLRFLPVSYRNTILFYLHDQSGSLERIHRQKFRSPFTCFDRHVQKTGRLSPPFFFLTWNDRSPTHENTYFPVVINRLGEIVWANIGFERTTGRDWHNHAEEIPGGILLRGQYAQGKMAKFYFDGRTEGLHDFTKDGVDSINHSFTKVGDDEIAIIQGKVRKVFLWNDYLTYFRSWRDLVGWAFQPSRQFFGNEVVLFNLKTKTSRTLYSSFDVFQTRRDVPVDGGGEMPTDPFLYGKEQRSDADLIRHPLYRDFEPAHVDWSHENSVHFDADKGYLITVRNLNSIVWLDPKGQFRGTIGPGPRSTWRWPANAIPFSMPHSARFFGDSFLLYDNAATTKTTASAPSSRILVFKINPTQPGQILITKEIPLSGAKSVDRGSVRALSPQRLLAYISRAPGHPIALQEFDLSREMFQEPVAALEINWPYPRRSQEAVPLSSLGFPEFHGKLAGATHRSTARDVQIKSTSLQNWQRPLEDDIY